VIWIVLILVLSLIFGYYVRGKAERLRAEAGSELFRGSVKEALRRPNVVVLIGISGKTANPEEVHQRLAIEDEIERRKLGNVADAGSEDGAMNLLVVALAFGYYVRGKAERLRAEAGAEVFRGSLKEALRRPHVIVLIAISGKIANPEEVHQRLAIEDEIERRKLGSVADAGSEDGAMNLLVVAAQGDADRCAAGINEILSSLGLLERSRLDIRRAQAHIT